MAIKTAIIGLGIMGRRMLDEMQRHCEFEVVSLWDPDPEAVSEVKVKTPDASIAISAEEALKKADLVYLACPPVPRRGYAMMAADEGKALFLEKPLGVDVATSIDLVERLKAASVPVAVNFTQAAGPVLNAILSDAGSGRMGHMKGIDIVLTYGAWPRAWQQAADWLRLRAEGGMTREVLSHFVFFSERVLGPLELVWARPSYPADPALCETHLLARLENAAGLPVTIMASVGGAQPDRQELTVKASLQSRRVTDFYVDSVSTGDAFRALTTDNVAPRSVALTRQLDDLALMVAGRPHRLATLDEALRVQRLVEAMLLGRG